MLASIMTKDFHTVEADIKPPSTVENISDKTVRIAIIGSISKIAFNKLKIKETIKAFRSFPEKSNKRLIR